MNTCEYCKSTLTQTVIERGRCPTCLRLILPEVADVSRAAATIQFPAPGSATAQFDQGTADDERIAQTLAAAGVAPTDGSRRAGAPAQRVGCSRLQPDRQVPPGRHARAGAAPGSPVTENDFRRIAGTVDSAISRRRWSVNLPRFGRANSIPRPIRRLPSKRKARHRRRRSPHNPAAGGEPGQVRRRRQGRL